MRGKAAVLVAALVFALALMASPTAGEPKLPAGVSFKVLAEFPSDIPGIEKVQLQEFRLEPGAKIENDVVPDTGF
ncbi:MAG: hypothetical protein ACE5JS_06770 [Nitrospinota bacterium]